MPTAKEYIEKNLEGLFGLLHNLCLIPAPSHHEEKRAAYCKEWLDENVSSGAYIDEALNVIYPLNCENSNEITVFAAHTDTVFSHDVHLKYVDDGQKISCPGIGDNTASVAVLLCTVKYFVENKISFPKGVLFVFNSCEEGLGNLKGTKQLFKDFEGRIKQFISLDSFKLNIANDTCVGSERYEVEVFTQGGHSYLDFGENNAINEISKIVREIYSINVPKSVGETTTYNVGEIRGGTSVNTIAQNAKILCEYRSTKKDHLILMQKKFEDIFKKFQKDDVKVKVTKIGERPCSDIDEEQVEKLKNIVKPVIENTINDKLSFTSSSTDCNIPLSLGVPAICVSVYNGCGAHTKEEWIEKDSLYYGLEIAINLVQKFLKI